MKKIFFGIFVAGVALTCSALTNANRTKLTYVYITGENGISPNKIYTYVHNSDGMCSGGSKPCSITSNGYKFLLSGTITEADINSSRVVITSYQTTY